MFVPLLSDGFVEETARDSAGETTSSLSSSADFPSSSALAASEAAFEPLREDLFDLSETLDPALEPAFDFLDLQRFDLIWSRWLTLLQSVIMWSLCYDAVERRSSLACESILT